jgi:hypothetical protein
MPSWRCVSVREQFILRLHFVTTKPRKCQYASKREVNGMTTIPLGRSVMAGVTLWCTLRAHNIYDVVVSIHDATKSRNFTTSDKHGGACRLLFPLQGRLGPSALGSRAQRYKICWQSKALFGCLMRNQTGSAERVSEVTAYSETLSRSRLHVDALPSSAVII